MTTSADLRTATVAALRGATNAGVKVFSPRDLPTWDGEYPILIVTNPDESGEGLGRIGAPKFNVTTTMRVLGRVQRPAEDDDVGAALIYEELEILRDQIKRALINQPALMSQLQQFPFFRCVIDEAGRESSSHHQGQVVVDVGMEFFQGPADFYQEPYPELSVLEAQIPEPAGTDRTGATINLPI